MEEDKDRGMGSDAPGLEVVGGEGDSGCRCWWLCYKESIELCLYY